MKTLYLLCVVLLLAWLSGCASVTPVQRGDSPEFSAIKPPSPLPPEQNQGGIFQAGNERTLFEDYKARRVGDILQVLLMERTNARKSASASTSKDSSVEIADPVIFGRPITKDGRPILGASIGGSRSFDGSGDAAQSNQLDGTITVTVAEVLGNGNLVVQGEKWIGINQGKEYIRLRGIVRPVDIRADNTVLSTQLANTQVIYGGTGALADSSSQGWLTRFFNHPIWPF